LWLLLKYVYKIDKINYRLYNKHIKLNSSVYWGAKWNSQKSYFL
jgi:hypothetical protein